MSTYESGTTFVSLLYALIKAAQVYDLGNDVIQHGAQRFVHFLNTLLNLYSHIEIIRYRDYVFFNKQRLRFQIDGYAGLQFLHERMKHLRIRTLTFKPGVEKEEIIIFASLFKDEDKFIREYDRKKFHHVRVEFSTGDEEIPDFLRDSERIKRTYFKALAVTKNLLQNLWTRQPANVSSSRRIVYNLIDSLSHDEFGLLALTTIKNFDEYTYNHSLNVGVFSLALGQRIGLSKKDLAQVGTAGLLHDIGKVSIDKNIIYKDGRLSENEWEAVKLHSQFGVEQILQTRGLDETGLVSMAVCYQHHWNVDGTGYPRRKGTEKPFLFSKIVRICDSYDAMTTARVYQPIPYLPHIALRVLWQLRHICFDPVLVKVFIQLSGLYPLGSCLEMSNGEVALVTRQNPGHFSLPIIKILMDKNQSIVDGQTIDLSVDKHIHIKRPVYPQKYSINPAEFFMKSPVADGEVQNA